MTPRPIRTARESLRQLVNDVNNGGVSQERFRYLTREIERCLDELDPAVTKVTAPAGRFVVIEGDRP